MTDLTREQVQKIVDSPCHSNITRTLASELMKAWDEWDQRVTRLQGCSMTDYHDQVMSADAETLRVMGEGEG